MLKIIPLLSAIIMLSACANHPHSNKNQFETIFNGNDLSGWIVKTHRYKLGEDPDNTFTVHNGMLRVDYTNYTGEFDDRFSHIYYEKPFTNFHLTLEYRFRGEMYTGAPSFAKLNSGVMFYAQSPDSILQNQNWPLSIEMQFLAAGRKGTTRTTGNVCTPGTDIYINGALTKEHCINSSSDTYYSDNWVSAELIVNNGDVTHIINGKTVLEYKRPQIGFTGTIKGIDKSAWDEGKVLSEGYISLQSEGHPIDFKNVKIKAL
ncbi:3-keto-disaccharide hydrolase [Agaribacter marinus]|uniref:3-keto-alpha-glucoside-1,2-lyase/3-keto-2-hydroxy-glucal hydratase domain-containing protein n=1 Tax=Agaribacter marinus TaxID=1431249 RepID=A0AA37SXY3_9ALTE|nr:DUF1080 domain-containing protein [Agaribacter marinus]GLR71916.1 hypothetical protein GCM10007852_28240 [Agaribacter marinus]